MQRWSIINESKFQSALAIDIGIYRFVVQGISVFSRATLGGAVVLTLLEYFEYVFLEKYLHDFQYKSKFRISMALAFDFT
jgi:hypothetical protein